MSLVLAEKSKSWDIQHSTGTDRVAEVVTRYPKFSVVVNIQGDRLFVIPTMLAELVTPYLEGESSEMITLACPLDHKTEDHNPNSLKVLCGQKQQALYFWQSPRQSCDAKRLTLPRKALSTFVPRQRSRHSPPTKK